MSVKGIYEILIYMDRFKNIDIYNQGIYYIILSCSYKGQETAPYLIEHESPSKLIKNPHLLQGPQLDDHSSSISSRLFLIRFAEETVQINESGVFRLELDLKPTEPIEIRVDLCYCPIGLHTKVPEIYKKINQSLSNFEFRKVSSSLFKVANPLYGASQFLPIKFPGVHASRLSCSIHCVLLCYKFYEDPEKSLEDLFFPHPVTSDLINSVYRKYMKPLLCNYLELRRVANKALREAEIQEAFPELHSPLTVGESSKIQYNLSDHLAHINKSYAFNVIINEINEIASNICEIRFSLSKLLNNIPQQFLKVQEKSFNAKVRKRWGENIYSERKTVKYCIDTDEGLRKSHNRVAKITRNNAYFNMINGLKIEGTEMFGTSTQAPIAFEEIYANQDILSDWDPLWLSTYDNSYSESHLIVMVHGFLGRSMDLKLFKDSILSVYPNTHVFMSTVNENKPQRSIAKMGKKLSLELVNYIEDQFSNDSLAHISFIGFSLGGLIVRAALPYLHEYSDKMKMLMTLNSPHLGCTSGDSKLIDAGLWILTKMKNSDCLRELVLSDQKDIVNSYLYKLSHAAGIEWFEYLILVSCSQDKMVPFDSARIEVTESSKLKQMADSLLGRLERTTLIRLDTNFGLSGKKLGKLIGRTAHLQAIESSSFHSLLLYRYSEAFKVY